MEHEASSLGTKSKILSLITISDKRKLLASKFCERCVNIQLLEPVPATVRFFVERHRLSLTAMHQGNNTTRDK
jgi:hypothetical protein